MNMDLLLLKNGMESFSSEWYVPYLHLFLAMLALDKIQPKGDEIMGIYQTWFKDKVEMNLFPQFEEQYLH